MGQRDLSAELGSILNGRVGIYSQGVASVDETLLKLHPGKEEFWLNELKILAEGRPGWRDTSQAEKMRNSIQYGGWSDIEGEGPC